MRKSSLRRFFIIASVLLMSMILGGCKNDTKSPEKDDKIADTATDQNAPEDNNTNDENTDGQDEAGKDVNHTPVAEPVEYTMHMGSVEVKEDLIYEEDFEGDSTLFVGRGAAKVEIVSGKAQIGSNSLFVSGRTALWNGATVDLSEELIDGEKYVIDGWVLYEEGPNQLQIDCKVERNNNQYLSFASTMAKRGEWTKIEGSIIIPEDTNTASVYFETGFADGALLDFYIDGITLKREIAIVDRGEIPSLKEVYKDLFSMGVAVTASEIPEGRQELIKQQFNSLTPGNELKPDSLLDHATSMSDPKYDDNPAISFQRVKPILDFAQEANIPVRGHTLVWHSQTPRWFFAVGYSTATDAPLVSKELMLKRMENYIRQVLEYAQTNYPGLIYAWDVVNEAINPGEGDENGYRAKESLWYEVVGPEFIEKAFEYARKYADPDVKLFYNDYNTEEKGRLLYMKKLVKELKEKGLIDGIGLQTHLTIDNPSLMDVNTSLLEYGELGLEVQITELDMGMTDNSEEELMRQAMRYKRLFMFINNAHESGGANITNVTFWGLSDDISWLNKPSVPSYPLLFDNYLLQKPAFWGVIQSPDIPLY
ncbi:MAG: glycoside hydrolase [Clostridiales bacterium]|jgi:endo-1,4-beta-xylanase|nr:glycoside hydrolase [Clostridiales bacterium]